MDYDRGGVWSGTHYMCTLSKSFLVRDVKDCQRRGYERTGFFEVDTGEATHWEIRLRNASEAGTAAR